MEKTITVGSTTKNTSTRSPMKKFIWNKNETKNTNKKCNTHDPCSRINIPVWLKCEISSSAVCFFSRPDFVSNISWGETNEWRVVRGDECSPLIGRSRRPIGAPNASQPTVVFWLCVQSWHPGPYDLRREQLCRFGGISWDISTHLWWNCSFKIWEKNV